MSVNHYENFPVASVLCPPALRPAVTAIYWFARTADDLADEGDASPADRLSDLRMFEDDLLTAAAGGTPSTRWARVFGPVSTALSRHRLPLNLLTDLLSAFRQDVVKQRYADRIELLDYCRRSANPVGRLLLHLYGIESAEALRQADQICTALQLANFWQDLSVDIARGRMYVPQADSRRRGVSFDIGHLPESAAGQALLQDLVHWTRDMMLAGSPLVHTVGGRGGWELRLVVQGGLRILDKVQALGSTVLTQRPTIGWPDTPGLLWRALFMNPAAARPAIAP